MIVLYAIIRVLVQVTLRIFYKEFSVQGRARLPRKGPLIMVANHPNTLMDPLVVASLLHQQVGFMGNGSLFRNKALAALLRYFNVIPVYRKQDILPGENIDNQDNFEHAREFLGKGGTLLIFPEGTSYAEKKLRDLRTGASRIALSFEKSRDFKGGLIVMPAALNYSASTRFRSRLRIDIGEPIAVADFQAAFEQDEAEAVRALTAAQRSQIAERMVILEDANQERVHQQIMRLFRTLKLSKRGPEALVHEKLIADRIRTLAAERPTQMEALQKRLDNWFLRLDHLSIQDGFFSERFQKWNARGLWAMQLVLLILGSPLYLIGLIGSWFPYWFPGWLAPRISDEIEYHAPIMMLVGMLLFPIWYALLVLLAWLVLGMTGWPLLLLTMGLPLTGAYARWYASISEDFGDLGGLLHIGSRKRSLVERLSEERAAILAMLEQSQLAPEQLKSSR